MEENPGEEGEEDEVRFRFSEDFSIDTSQEPWRNEGLRVGFFANPGAGKSYTAALLVEQWLDQGGTVVIFEPRAEWHTLKQRYPVQVVGGPFLQDVPFVASEPSLYAKVVVEQGVSLVFYTGDVEEEEKLVEFVTTFIHRLLRLQEQYHRPVLLVVEETQEYAPRTAQGHIAPPWIYNRMIKALKDCFTQGRKLNVCPVAISQRPQEVNFTIRQLANLVWFGGFSAQDAKYLDTEVFTPFRRQGVEVSAQDLLGVPTGEWLVITGRTTTHVKVTEKRKTPHGADTPTLEYVAPVGEDIGKAVSALGEQLKAMLEKRAAEESENEKLKRQNRELLKKVEDLDGKVKLGVDLKALFQGNGVSEKEMEKRIGQITRDYDKRLKSLEQNLEDKDQEIREIQEQQDRNQVKSQQELARLEEKAKQYEEEHGDFTEFKRVMRKMLGPSERVVERVEAAQGPSSDEVRVIVDERLNQRLREQPSPLVVDVDLSGEFRSLIKQDFIRDVAVKVSGLTEDQKRMAVNIRENKKIKSADLFFAVRGVEVKGRMPANFYQQINKLEEAHLVAYNQPTGMIAWHLDDFVDEKLMDLYDEATRRQVKDYLTSLLLPTQKPEASV